MGLEQACAQCFHVRNIIVGKYPIFAPINQYSN